MTKRSAQSLRQRLDTAGRRIDYLMAVDQSDLEPHELAAIADEVDRLCDESQRITRLLATQEERRQAEKEDEYYDR